MKSKSILKIKKHANINNMSKLSARNPRGFTLIELLVVVAIIATLAGIIIASMRPVQVKARDTKRISDLNLIKSALAQYYVDQGFYPTPGIWVWGGLKLEGTGTTTTLTNQVGNPGYVAPLRTYITLLPRDPQDQRDAMDVPLPGNDSHYCYVSYASRAIYTANRNNFTSCDNTTVLCKYYVLYSKLEDPNATTNIEPGDTCAGHFNYRVKVSPD